ncbi:helicase C-terminal domain-containing protein [Gemmatimonas sp.]|uniref:helicase C-terminal domain-containing protein n=1 Tax=Gemmatimonas sp. TaxID=1962908 RepID=UPI0037BF65B2
MTGKRVVKGGAKTAGGTRLSPKAASAVRVAIKLAGGNEVCFVCTVDDDNLITTARVVFRGDVRSVLALPGVAERGELMLHNHPSGLLEPSDADLEVAARIHGNGVGFAIVDNEATRVYVVAEVPRSKQQLPVSLDDVDVTLGPYGLIAQTMQRVSGSRDYEDRPSQRAMAAAVTETFNRGGVALLEAGTGVGKSLGYLVPALRWAAANGERTIVSTNTITLQEQLVTKDLPFLQRALTDQKVRFALLKGWRNYLCLQRLEQARGAGAALFDDGGAGDVEQIAEWAEKTQDGSLADLPTPPRPDVWDEVAAEPDLCGRMKCSFYDKCFLFKARKEAAAADVVVVNHHLLLSDVAVRRQAQNWEDSAVLPAYKRLVIDEGHHLEDAAASHLGSSITRRALARLFNRLERRGKGLLPALAAKLGGFSDLHSVASLDLVRERMVSSAATARDRTQLLFELLSAVLEGTGAPILRLTDEFQQHPLWLNGIEDTLAELLIEIASLSDGLRLVTERLESDQKRSEEMAPLLNEVRAVTRRLAGAGDSLSRGLQPPKDKDPVVRWMEFQGKPTATERNVAVHCVPLDLAPVLRDDLFGRVATTVITSATLATDGGFGFLEQRLGLDEGAFTKRTAIFESPFNYPRQALLVVPTDLPAPNEQPREHFAAVVQQMRDLIVASDGGLFGLFTSHRDVREMAQQLRELGMDGPTPLLVHGEEPRDVLLQRFRDSGRAVLLGTATFWEGVDVPGNALRGLLIAKLPFRVPSEPMVAAQCEAIEARGGNAFAEFMLPHASLRLKQGFGRLIRTATDSGVVVISDPRVVTKRYGRDLLNALPPAKRVMGPWGTVRDEVSRFYASDRTKR